MDGKASVTAAAAGHAGRQATCSMRDGVLVAQPLGPSLRESDASALLDELAPLVPQAGGRLLLDMARVEFMVSAGIAMLVRMHELCHAHGGRMAVCGLTPTISEVLRTTRVSRLFVVAQTREKALRKIA